MLSFGRNCCFKYPGTYFRRRNASNHTNTILSPNSFCHKFPDPNDPFGKNPRFFHHAHKLDLFLFQINTSYTQFPIPFAPFNSHYSTKAPSRSYQRRARKRLLKSSKPTLDQAQFQLALSQLPPRFTPEELCNVIARQNDPLVCLELFHWASQQPRFRHDVSTFHITIKKLGAAKMYQEMDDIVNQLLAVPLIGSEALFNMVIYYFTQARKLTRAVNVFKHMKSRRNLNCCFRPSIRTYNILFAACLGRGSNSYINHVYMETIRCLFRQMVKDGIKPDIFSLNSMIKGYVLSLHVNDALRIFHQMGVIYDCQPNALTYDCLIHGLCSQGRTNNAKELYSEMKTKGFVPSSKSYNSLVNSLALGGEIEEAVNYLWEMTDKQRSADFITYKTVLDEICRRGTVQEGMRFLQELQEKDLVDGYAYRKLLYVLEDDYGNSVSRIDSVYNDKENGVQRERDDEESSEDSGREWFESKRKGIVGKMLASKQDCDESRQMRSNPQIDLTSSLFTPTQTQTWYPDSGASLHVTNMSQNIQQVTPFEGPDQIIIDNGQGLTINSSGF